MSTDVYLVRHGETMFNQLNKLQGWCDSRLAVQELYGIKVIAIALSQVHFDTMYSSELKSARVAVRLLKEANLVSAIAKIEQLPAFRDVFLRTCEGDDLNQTGDQVAMAAG